jgi:hypothetical protein
MRKHTGTSFRIEHLGTNRDEPDMRIQSLLDARFAFPASEMSSNVLDSPSREHGIPVTDVVARLARTTI